MPLLEWLNENPALSGRLSKPVKTVRREFWFDGGDKIYLLFDFIEGKAARGRMTPAQLTETAEILAHLHGTPLSGLTGSELQTEDFSVPFCFALERFILTDLTAAPADARDVILPNMDKLTGLIGWVKEHAERLAERGHQMVLCHTDAHGFNLIQGEGLALVDWDGVKLAPAELDLMLYTKKDYWEVFLLKYASLRPGFTVDDNLLRFYVRRRRVEDIWACVESIMSGTLTDGPRKREMDILTACIRDLGDDFFALSLD
jgi:aminoglycoside phosphotransferase (APT) family kinase protein